MNPNLTPYPTSLPADVLIKALAVLRGNFGDKKEDAHYLYEIEGYALGRFFNDQPQPMAACPCEPCTSAEAADLLESCCDDSGTMKAMPAGFWLKILGAVVKLLPLLVAA